MKRPHSNVCRDDKQDNCDKYQKLDSTEMSPIILETKKIFIIEKSTPYVYLSANLKKDNDLVKIGSFMYKVKYCDYISDNYIGLNSVQYDDLRHCITNNEINICFNFRTLNDMKSITVRIENTDSEERKLQCSLDHMSVHIYRYLRNHYVSCNQCFSFIYKLHKFIVSIDDSSEYVGRVSSKTKIRINTSDSFGINLYDKCIVISSSSVEVTISKCSPIDEYSLIVDRKSLANLIEEFLENIDIPEFNESNKTESQNLIFKYLTYELTLIVKVNPDLEKLRNRKNIVWRINRLNSNSSSISLISGINKVILTNGFCIAKKLKFSIHEAKNQKYIAENRLICIDECIKALRHDYIFFLRNQMYPLLIRGILYLIKCISVESELLTPFLNSNTFSLDNLAYKCTENTNFKFEQTKNSSLSLYSNIQPNLCHRIEIKVRFLSILKNKSLLICTDKMDKFVRRILPNEFCKNYNISCWYKTHPITISIRNYTTTKDTMKLYYEKLCISSDTKLKISISKKNTTVIRKSKSEIVENPLEKLTEHIGGCDEEIKKIIRTLIHSRGKMRKEFAERGLRAPKGLILYGLPGNAKTKLAREIGAIFGCEVGDRFQLIAGSEIFQKYVGESEDNVRKLFKPAKLAWKKFGIDSPLYIVVIDEIDALLSKRNSTSGNRVGNSVVNQFLADMDGLVQFDNILCIGMTNRLELLDPAVLRPGRFGIHIEIKNPTASGRKEIFAIHTKILREKNRLSSEINFDKLVELTDGYSGAEIEGLIERASSYSLDRLSKMVEVIDKDYEQSILEKDFLEAMKELKPEKDTISLPMYS